MKNTIQGIRLNSLTNETHTQFCTDVDALFSGTGIEASDFASLHALYRSALAEENKALDYMSKSAVTGSIAEEDNRRDSLFRGFYDVVKGCTNHYDAALSRQAVRLLDIILFYGNITKKPLSAETAALNDLLRELSAPEPAAAVAALELTEWVSRLAESNRNLSTLMLERDSETAAKRQHQMKTARVAADRYYRALVSLVEIRMLTESSPQLQTFVAGLNATIARYDNTLNRAGKITKKTS